MSRPTITELRAWRRRAIFGLGTALLAAQAGCSTPGIAPITPSPAAAYAELLAAVPERAVVQPAAPRRLLVFSRSEGFVHEAIPATEAVLRAMGEQTGAFEVTVASEMSVFDEASLARFDAVLFNNTTQLAFENPAQRRALLAFVRGGKGVIGIHAATDNFYNWPEAASMMGGLFDGHPWGAGGTWAVKLDEPGHPLNRSFAGNAFLIRDEIYQITGPYSRATHRVLLSLDMSNLRNREVEGIKRDDDDFAISWIKPFGDGRVFYCSLGHNLEVLGNAAVLAHYLAGIQYALGDLDVDDTPSGTLSPAPRPALSTESGAIDDPFAAVARLEFGDSRLPQAAIEERIRGASPDERRAIEDRLIVILDDPESTYAAKQFVCRMLRSIGSDRSIPSLARLLHDARLTDDARFALQGHPSPAVDRILRESLGELSGPALIGVVGTIGQRRDAEAVPRLVALIDTTDPALTGAIVVALGRIGGADARQALSTLALPATLEPLRRDALLRCADDLALGGAHAEARAVYRQMTADTLPVTVRVAAWRGLVRSQQAEALPSLLAMLRSSDPEIQRAGARFMLEMQGVVDPMPVARALGSFPESARVLAVSALGSAGVRGAAPIVTGLVERETGAVHTAAVRALGEIGDASHVPLLAAVAIGDGDSLAARESLTRLSGPGVDDRIVAEATRHRGDARAVLIEVLADRNAVAAVPTFLAYAEDPDASVRLASIDALSRLAENSRLPDLLALLERSGTPDDRIALEHAIAALCERMPDPEAGLHVVLSALEVASGPDRVSFLRILGALPHARSLAALQQATADASAEVRVAAIAGVLQQIGASPDRPSAEVEHAFRSLLARAGTTEEKGMILDALEGRSDAWALGMVAPLRSDPELGAKAEAIRAALIESVARTVSHDGAGASVTLAHEYAAQYDGGSRDALTDGRWGSTNPGDGAWQGFEGADLDAVVDLGDTIDIRSIRAGFLRAHGSWIFLPREVSFAIAGEDRVFETVATFPLDAPEAAQRAATWSVSTELSGRTARYVRVVARNIGELPAWHSAAGEAAWLFADEIQINAHLDGR